MDVLVQFIWIGDTGGIEGFNSRDQCPKGGAVSLSDDVVGNSVTSSMPSGRNLTSDCATELEGFGNEDTGTFFEFGEPLPTLTSPDVALVTVLEFELLRFGVGHLDGLEIVDKLDFLVEDPVGVVTTEQLRLCVYDISLILGRKRTECSYQSNEYQRAGGSPSRNGL